MLIGFLATMINTSIELPLHSSYSCLKTKPCRHLQRCDPAVFIHCCLSPQMLGFCSHSSMSTSQEFPVYPGLHTHPLTLSQVDVPSSLHSHLFLQSTPHKPNAHSTNRIRKVCTCTSSCIVWYNVITCNILRRVLLKTIT